MNNISLTRPSYHASERIFIVPFFLEWEDGKRGGGFFYAALVGIDIRKENGS
jgi:hypothetical protein